MKSFICSMVILMVCFGSMAQAQVVVVDIPVVRIETPNDPENYRLDFMQGHESQYRMEIQTEFDDEFTVRPVGIPPGMTFELISVDRNKAVYSIRWRPENVVPLNQNFIIRMFTFEVTQKNGESMIHEYYYLVAI